MNRGLVKWHDQLVGIHEKKALEHIVGGNITYGITPDEIRHLFEGEILTARRALHNLAKKKLLKKKIVKRPSNWDGARGLRKVAIFYPIEYSADHVPKK